MEHRPIQFPVLPPCSDLSGHWSHDVRQAHELLCSTYDHASRFLRQEDHDPLQLQTLLEKIFSDSIPLLEALDMKLLNPEWVDECAQALAATVVELRQAIASATSRLVIFTRL
jgi:hypothetical protein